MKKLSIVAIVLILVIMFNISAPIVCASGINNNITLQPTTAVTCGDYSINGVENTTVRYNIIINNAEQTGQFAIVYLDSLDYMYEFCFNLDDVSTGSHDNMWEDFRIFCFSNKDNWVEVYLPSAVIVEDEVQSSTAFDQSRSTASDVAYFENWLLNRYGNEYSGRVLLTGMYNGTTTFLKEGFQVRVYKDYTYVIAQTLTVAGFITGVLGVALEVTLLSVLGAIVGTGGLFLAGEKVHEYKVRANWFRYVTFTSGTGYPYGLADKYICYDGYSYTGTGGCNVDEASAATYYDPSSAQFNSYTELFNAAYAEYQQIGWQEGNY